MENVTSQAKMFTDADPLNSKNDNDLFFLQEFILYLLLGVLIPLLVLNKMLNIYFYTVAQSEPKNITTAMT